MAFDPTTYALSKKYTKESLEGAGSLKGEPGPPGKDATINGVNVTTITGGENVNVDTDSESGTITVSAPILGADKVVFSDGETFQEKYDAGDLTGPQGPKGDTGDPGTQGESGKTPTLRIDENGHLIATY